MLGVGLIIVMVKEFLEGSRIAGVAIYHLYRWNVMNVRFLSISNNEYQTMLSFQSTGRFEQSCFDGARFEDR